MAVNLPAPQIYSISEITRQLKDLVEANFPHVAVCGEISSCSRAGSGHYYFTLKDSNAQLRAVMWRSSAARLRFDVHDGLDVVAVGPIEIYEARGSYQMIVEELVPRGLGALELAFRQLQAKLAAEGLFDPARKRPLPKFPKRIALVTSPTGAAVRDMLQVMTRRWCGVDIVIVPVPVQGAGAAAEIAAALRDVHRIPGVDVVICGRGGGSLEDLWAFNEEVVARAIAACRIPVVSAVGHEIDVTIADLAADSRALTPSEAAEIVVPNRIEIQSELNRAGARMMSSLRARAARARDRVDAVASGRSFVRPFERIRDFARRLDELSVGFERSFRRKLDGSLKEIDAIASTLHALSPLNVLKRGYSITRRTENGEVVRNAAHVEPGDSLETILEQGRILSRVESYRPHDDTDLAK